MKTALLTILILALYALHQDVWNWRSAGPLLFGFIPIGLSYHAAFTVAASALMWMLVKFAWPSHLERDAEQAPSLPRDNAQEGAAR
ncbi:MAG TPA: DUF3311 domain-containing protein [Blastocatellia bacterium]|jgi:hypothetical protein|nr:DUF3311 domain-containing protein [Blastocatellia bacterium]